MKREEAPILIAEFGSPNSLTTAARRLSDAGFPPLDALSPCPVDGLQEALPLPPSPIRWSMLIAGVAVAILFYGLEYWTAVYANPLDAGGRPLNSWPIFFLAPFEVSVLSAAIAGFVALLVLCGLPRLNHRIFEWDAVERATDDRYFLVMSAPVDASDFERLRSLLGEAQSLGVGGPF